MSGKELTNKVREFKELQIFIQQLQEEAEVIKAEITTEMEARQTEKMLVDVFKVRYTTVTSSRFDTTAFKATHKELYSQYTKPSFGKRFSIA